MICTCGEVPPTDYCVKLEWSNESLHNAGATEREVVDWAEVVFSFLGVPRISHDVWGWEDGECLPCDDKHMGLVIGAQRMVSDQLSSALDRVLVSEGVGYEDLLAYHRRQDRALREMFGR